MTNDLINKLKKKANKNLTVKSIFYNSQEYETTLDFLKKQNFIKFKDIEKILNIHFTSSEPLGNILINEKKKIVGFLGTIFGERPLKNLNILQCYLHTWIVEKEYRFQAYRLLIPVIQRKIFISTFSPIKSLEGLYKKLGFEKKFLNPKFLFGFPLNFKKKNLQHFKKGNEFEQFLSKKDLKIYKDHKNKNIGNFLFLKKNNNEYLYLIVKKNFKKKIIPVVEILYTSNDSNYLIHKKEINSFLAKQFKTILILKNFSSDNMRYFCKAIYYLNKPSNFNFDLLYSELC